MRVGVGGGGGGGGGVGGVGMGEWRGGALRGWGVGGKGFAEQRLHWHRRKKFIGEVLGLMPRACSVWQAVNALKKNVEKCMATRLVRRRAAV